MGKSIICIINPRTPLHPHWLYNKKEHILFGFFGLYMKLPGLEFV